ncbi:hypothetical protein JOC24_003679 [Streptomyces sp. HB132]|nr:hypothetical protein [Streptomyces sp. HB132]
MVRADGDHVAAQVIGLGGCTAVAAGPALARRPAVGRRADYAGSRTVFSAPSSTAVERIS